MQEIQVQSVGWEDPLEKVIATHSSILAWKIPWTKEPGGLQSMGVAKNWTWPSDWACNNILTNKSYFLSVASVLTSPTAKNVQGYQEPLGSFVHCKPAHQNSTPGRLGVWPGPHLHREDSREHSLLHRETLVPPRHQHSPWVGTSKGGVLVPGDGYSSHPRELSGGTG